MWSSFLPTCEDCVVPASCICVSVGTHHETQDATVLLIGQSSDYGHFVSSFSVRSAILLCSGLQVCNQSWWRVWTMSILIDIEGGPKNIEVFILISTCWGHLWLLWRKWDSMNIVMLIIHYCHFGRGNLNWGTPSVRLAVGHVMGQCLDWYDWCWLIIVNYQSIWQGS